jgi:hypothetical protein
MAHIARRIDRTVIVEGEPLSQNRPNYKSTSTKIITEDRYMETESRISVVLDLADFRSFKTALDSIS